MSTSSTPKKDVIYVDIEDDITAVIEKVKEASAPIVALVPPKRIGVLQSVVNLKLLNRAASTAKKRIVLISNDKALHALAAGLAIPVAKNLQSKPEVPELSTVAAEDDEVINGEELPIGELERTSDVDAPVVAAAIAENADATPEPSTAKKSDKKKKKSAVPNFDVFRRKMFLFGGLGVVLVAFLIWALFFAGHATVEVAARTNIVNIAQELQLREDATLDVNQGVAPATIKEVKKTANVDFTATGKKDVGEKATGTAEFSQQSLSSKTVPAGTTLTSDEGLKFITNESVTVPASTFGPGCFPTACPGTATGSVTAAEAGTKYNAADGNLNGAPNGVSATFTGPTSGGTDKTVTVVSQADVNKAKDQLESDSSEDVRAELEKQFADTDIVIQESYKVTAGKPTSSPGIGEQASSATLTVETTYRLVGMARSDLRAIYDAYTNTQIDTETQKIYTSGDDATSFSQFEQNRDGFVVQASAAAQVGPNIDDRQLATELVGKRAGEIQQEIEAIQGVDDVTVKFSPFWVTKAPSSADKIDIKFVVNQ